MILNFLRELLHYLFSLRRDGEVYYINGSDELPPPLAAPEGGGKIRRIDGMI